MEDNYGFEEIDQRPGPALQPKGTIPTPKPQPPTVIRKTKTVTVRSPQGATQRLNVTTKPSLMATTVNYLGDKYATDETHISSVSETFGNVNATNYLSIE